MTPVQIAVDVWRLNRAALDCGVPTHDIEGLVDYIVRGIPLGGFRRFHNRLRILKSIDFPEFVAAGICGEDGFAVWHDFARDPIEWLIRAHDERAQAVWSIIRAREPA